MIVSNFNQHKDTLRITETLIDNLDEEALIELLGGNGGDIDYLFEKLFEEIHNSLHYNEGPIKTSSFDYLDKFSAAVEETFRVESFIYFIQSVLTDFIINWHHIEQANILKLYRLTAFLASRGSGKSFLFSKALPLWRMYRYRRALPLERLPRDIQLCEIGMLFTHEMGLAEELLLLIKNDIEGNDVLRERLYNGTGDNWSKRSITCKNGARMSVKSFGSAARGRHPGWIVVDDFLIENVLFSKDFNDKIINYYYSVIENMVLRGGGLTVVGCVHPNSIVLTKQGLMKIGHLNPSANFTEKELIPLKLDVLGKNGFSATSHYWVNGICKTKKITTAYGMQLECSLIHPLWKMNQTGIPDWEQSQFLKKDDWIGIKVGQGFGEATTIDLQPLKIQLLSQKGNGLNLPDYLDSDLAYLVGLWVAEGSIMSDGRVSIVNTEKEIQDSVLNNAYDIPFKLWGQDNEYRMFTQNIHFLLFLKFIGVEINNCGALNKQIPCKILSCGEEILKAFLQGLFDGDGGAYIHKGYFNIILGSISETLLREVQTILLHFGILSSLSQRTTLGISERAIGKHYIWILSISGVDSDIFMQKIGFRLKRKQNTINYKEKGLKYLKNRVIPHQTSLIKQARKEKGYVHKGKKIDKDFFSSSLLYSTIRIDTLQSFWTWNQLNGAKGPAMDQIYNNIQEDVVYVKIKNIEDSESYTVDFHIPNDHSFITNGIISHNTPFSSHDLYAKLKANKKYQAFEYPAIYPDGSLLWPEFMPFSNIVDKKESQGNIIFSREILCKPISTESTIFPYDMMAQCFSPSFTLIKNIYSSPVRFKKVVLGCDFARSANVGADFSTFITLALDEQDCIWILNIYREKGKSFQEQIAVCKMLHSNFKYDLIFMEDNQMQSLFVDGAKEANLPVKGFTTGRNKNSLKEGWPSLAILFENRKFKIPRGDQYSIDMTDIVVAEFGSVAFTSEGLKSTSQHDDTCSAIWIGTKALQENSDVLKFHD